jgi:hypothetical protein
MNNSGIMKDIYAKCGFNCGRCPAYKDNAKTEEQKKHGSDGWKKYFGFRLNTERMYCDGCQTPDKDNPVMFIPKCRVRVCAFQNNMMTCGHCSEFKACMHELKVFDSDITREKIEERMGTHIPEEDYQAFIAPFEHLRNLEDIRAFLKDQDITEPAKIESKSRVVEFPQILPFSKSQTAGFRTLHKILWSLTSIDGDTQAQQSALKTRRELALNILWAFGISGISQNNRPVSILESQKFYAHKLTAHPRKVTQALELLKEQRIDIEIIPDTEETYGEKDWLTPMGWLRKKGWHMILSFSKKAEGAHILQALRSYAARLQQKYGERGFRYFKTADMRILKKEKT